MKEENSIPYLAGDTLLDKGLSYKLPFAFGMRLPLKIRPLKGGTIIHISQQVTRLEKVDENENMIPELLRVGGNVRIIARIIALATLNSPGRIFWFRRILTRIILWNVESMASMAKLMTLVYKQMGAEHFFFTMTSTAGMNFLKRKEGAVKPGADSPSGEP